MSRLSRARTLPVPIDPKTPLQWPDKYQNDTLDYALNPTLWLRDGHDQLTSVTVIPQPASNLTVLWWGIVEGKAAFALTGGTPGATTLTLTLTTLAGRQQTVRSALIIHSDNTPLTPPPPTRLPGAYCIPPSTLSDNATILTLSTGAPLTL